MRRFSRVIAIALMVLGLPLALIACAPETGADEPVSANVDDFSFQSLDVQYTLGRDADGTSTLEVVERFVAEFPDYDQNRGMRRSIPDSYLGAPLQPELVSITDGEGVALPEETDSDDGTFTMTSRAEGYVYGAQTYVFTYTLRNVTRYFENTGVDEFFWNVMGADSLQSFGRVSARLRVPADLAGALTGAQACYVGAAGSTQRCQIETDAGAAGADGFVVIEASAPDVQPAEAVTMSVAFARGTFTAFDSSYFASPWGWTQAGAALGLLGAFVLAIRARVRHLRDESGRPVIIAEFVPPRQVEALQSAVLLGKTPKAIPAAVLEQAVAGSIRIVESARKKLTGVDLKAVLVDPSRADADGMLLLTALFPTLTPGDEFDFSRDDSRFSVATQKMLKLTEEELATRGLRRKVPRNVRTFPLVLVLITALAVIVGGIVSLATSVDPLLPLVLIFVAVLVVIVGIVIIVRAPLSAEGAEVRDHLAGLKLFIEWAEADRIRMLQSPEGAERVRVTPNEPVDMLKLYEALLPYAVIFGQEKQWAERLAVLWGPENSPGWYSGSTGFTAATFSAGIGALSSSASSSASMAGGSSGGGSAGGGGGGGGAGGV